MRILNLFEQFFKLSDVIILRIHVLELAVLDIRLVGSCANGLVRTILWNALEDLAVVISSIVLWSLLVSFGGTSLIHWVILIYETIIIGLIFLWLCIFVERFQLVYEGLRYSIQRRHRVRSDGYLYVVHILNNGVILLVLDTVQWLHHN